MPKKRVTKKRAVVIDRGGRIGLVKARAGTYTVAKKTRRKKK